MRFTNIRDLKYNTKDKSRIDLFATCEEYGEIPMTLILTDTEDLHTFFDGKTEYPLEEYCKKQKIQDYLPSIPTIEDLHTSIKAKAGELINSKYPDYKQLNIIRVGGAELEEMTAYIDGIRAISNKAEQDGTKVEDVQWQS